MQEPFQSRRSSVYARGGMVASSQPLATEAGVSILKAGGNAADAAVATAAVLAVTEPCSTGLGGDFFALYYHAADRQVHALNASGRSPQALTLSLLQEQGFGQELPPFHAHTITVPGTCSGWCDLLSRFGRLDRPAVLAPAIHHAEHGFPVAPVTAQAWRNGLQWQLAQSPAGEELLIDGRPPAAGEVFRNAPLANSLRLIAEGGNEAFYRGELAQEIANIVQQFGGTLTLDDLAAHRATWETPISTTFAGRRLHECPPNGQGLTALLALNILAACDLDSLGEPLGSRRLHHMIEAFRIAFADTRWFVADPQQVHVPVAGLLSREYANERGRLIDPQRATLDVQHGSPVAGSDTVYFSVVDGEGNACSVVNSNYMGFGTGIVAPGTGFTLQNRGHNFSLDPEHPNAVGPGKRPYHTIIPAMSTWEEDESLFACFGVMGGFMQPQGHVQVFLGLVQDGLEPQAALDRPRFCLEGGDPAGVVSLELGIESNVQEELRRMGHEVREVQGPARGVFGRGQVILLDRASGVLCGGSDPRADGLALGF